MKKMKEVIIYIQEDKEDEDGDVAVEDVEGNG
jgi:hypothetical protein